MARRESASRVYATVAFVTALAVPEYARASDFSGIGQLLSLPFLAGGLLVLGLLAFLGGPPGRGRRLAVSTIAGPLVVLGLPLGADGCGSNPGEVQALFWSLLGGTALVAWAAHARALPVVAALETTGADTESDVPPKGFTVRHRSSSERPNLAEPYRHAPTFEQELELVYASQGTRTERMRSAFELLHFVAPATVLAGGYLWLTDIWMPLAFLLLFVGALVLVFLEEGFKETSLRVGKGKLSVDHFRLFAPSGIELSVTDIDGFVIAEQARFRRASVRLKLTVIARLTDGREEVLITKLPTARHAEWLVQELSAATGSR
jgi:hypothetical protein